MGTLSIVRVDVTDLSPSAALPQLTDLDISMNQLKSLDVLDNWTRLGDSNFSGERDNVLNWTLLTELPQLTPLVASDLCEPPSAAFLRLLTQLKTIAGRRHVRASRPFACGF